MRLSTNRSFAVALLATSMVLAGTAAAFAVSDGQYNPATQHCSPGANDSSHPAYTEPGCHNFTVVLYDNTGHEYFGYGLHQTPDGTSVDPTNPDVWYSPTGGDPSTGMHAYFGADDNLDNGEHDGSSQWPNGPSDGGAIRVDVDPANAQAWANALSTGDVGYLLTNPVPLVNGGLGACADGHCAAVETQRRVAFQGGNTKKSRDSANYEGKQWDPTTCAGPSDTKADCGGHPLSYWNNKEGTVYNEPGVQTYEDPDAQGSPEPANVYPDPALYAGTCGVVAGGGPVQAPASPVTNSAGQVVISTGCPQKSHK